LLIVSGVCENRFEENRKNIIRRIFSFY